MASECQRVPALPRCCTSNMKAQPLSISSLPVIPSMRVIWADGLGSVVSSAEQRQIEQGRPKRPEWNESSLHVCAYSLCDHRKWLIEPSTVVRMDIREFKWKGYLLGSALDLLLQSSIASNFSSRNETGIDVGKVSSVPLRSFINTFFCLVQSLNLLYRYSSTRKREQVVDKRRVYIYIFVAARTDVIKK